jgi:hypothetical protein
MSRRLEIELTSERPDGTWTWRAAGAKQPKGELSASVLPDGAKVGDVLRADADFAVDGIDIIAVLPPKAARKEPERLVVVGTQKDEPLVNVQLAPKGRGGGRRDRGDRGDRDRGDRGDRRGGPRGDRDRDGDRPRRDRSDRPRGPRPDPVPERPKPKRLRPGRTHRSAILNELAPEERPIAEQVLRGGVPAVREAIAKQNEQARAENRPEIPTDQLVALAEKLLPKLRAAEWHDKADAALADLEELDLRDLRSVVVAADGNTRDEESRALLAQLQEGLARRVEQEQTNWIDDMTANLDAGRFVRALRLSSRPPKAGTPLPPELATRLITAVSEGLTPTVNQDLWAAAVDALAFSPVRNQVVPAGRPEQPSQTLLDAVMRVGDRLPKLVELFGLDPAEVAKAAKRRPRGGGRPGAKGGAPRQGAKSDKSRSDKGPKGEGPKAEAAATADAAPASDSESVAAPNDPGAGAEPTDGSLAQGAHGSQDEVARDAAADDTATAEATVTPDAPASAEETAAAPEDDAADAPASEADTVTVDVQGDEGPSEVEVPAAAEQAVASDAAAAADDQPADEEPSDTAAGAEPAEADSAQ